MAAAMRRRCPDWRKVVFWSAMRHEGASETSSRKILARTFVRGEKVFLLRQ